MTAFLNRCIIKGCCLVLLALAARCPAQALSFSKLTENIYAYTTWSDFGGTPFPSNSLYLLTLDGIVLFDTPWDTTQFQPLLDSLARRHALPVRMCISTHSHADRTAGVAHFRAQGIPTYAFHKTRELCIDNGEHVPEFGFGPDTVFVVDGVPFEVFFPGAGHTADNVVVWFPTERVLYGGCLVKSKESKGLGNVADADVAAWPGSIKAVQKRYREARIVVPGHFPWGGKGLLRWTGRLLRAE